MNHVHLQKRPLGVISLLKTAILCKQSSDQVGLLALS